MSDNYPRVMSDRALIAKQAAEIKRLEGEAAITNMILEDSDASRTIRDQRAEITRLREWIAAEGERAQMCTFAVLREPCPDGKCCAKRRAALAKEK